MGMRITFMGVIKFINHGRLDSIFWIWNSSHKFGGNKKDPVPIYRQSRTKCEKCCFYYGKADIIATVAAFWSHVCVTFHAYSKQIAYNFACILLNHFKFILCKSKLYNPLYYFYDGYQPRAKIDFENLKRHEILLYSCRCAFLCLPWWPFDDLLTTRWFVVFYNEFTQ